MAIPPYSTFSATSELLVTAAVYYVVWKAYAHGDLRKGMLVTVLAFEAVVNISYMAYRFAVPNQALSGAPGWLTSVAVLHGILSLAMFIGLVFLAALAWRDDRTGGNFFREQAPVTWSFVGLWGVSVASGELLYVGFYL